MRQPALAVARFSNGVQFTAPKEIAPWDNRVQCFLSRRNWDRHTARDRARVTLLISEDGGVNWSDSCGFTALGGRHIRKDRTLAAHSAIQRNIGLEQNHRRRLVCARIETELPVECEIRTDARGAMGSRARHNSVTFDNSDSVSGLAVAGLTISNFVIASNTNRVLYAIGDASSTSPPTFTDSAWGADALSELYDAVLQTNFRKAVYRLIAPTAATRDVTINASGSADEFLLQVIAVYNADQATPNGTIVANSGVSGTSSWVACDGVTAGLAIGAAYGGGTAITPVDGIPEYIAVGTAVQSSAATTLTPGAPAGALRGDYDFASIATENNAAISVSGAGWAKVGTAVQPDSTWQEEIYLRVRTSANVDPVFSWSGSVGCSARRWLIRDAKTTGAVGFHATNSGSGSTHSATGQNATGNDSCVVYLSHAEANTALGADADYVEKFDAGSATGPYRLVVGTRDQATSGAGAANFSATGASASWVMRLLECLQHEAGDQTAREEIENINSFNSGALATEAGQLYNTFGWTFTGPTGGWHAVAFVINPAAEGSGAGSSTGAATTAATGAASAAADASSAGTGTPAATGASLASAAASAAGVAAAEAFGEEVTGGTIEPGDALSEGTSTVQADAAAIAAADASSQGISVAAAIGEALQADIAAGAASSAGLADAQAEGASDAEAVILSEGDSDATAIGEDATPSGQTTIITLGARNRWREERRRREQLEREEEEDFAALVRFATQHIAREHMNHSRGART